MRGESESGPAHKAAQMNTRGNAWWNDVRRLAAAPQEPDKLTHRLSSEQPRGVHTSPEFSDADVVRISPIDCCHNDRGGLRGTCGEHWAVIRATG